MSLTSLDVEEKRIYLDWESWQVYEQSMQWGDDAYDQELTGELDVGDGVDLRSYDGARVRDDLEVGDGVDLHGGNNLNYKVYLN
jgi:hypothetical protein